MPGAALLGERLHGYAVSMFDSQQTKVSARLCAAGGWYAMLRYYVVADSRQSDYYASCRSSGGREGTDGRPDTFFMLLSKLNRKPRGQGQIHSAADCKIEWELL